MEPEIETFDDLILGEKDRFYFDFTDLDIAEDETLSNPVCNISVVSGEDNYPEAMIPDTIELDEDGLIASVLVEGTTPDVTYCIAVSVQSDKGRILTISALLTVVRPCRQST